MDYSELVYTINTEAKVSNLTAAIVEYLNLSPIESGDDEQYYLKTVNWIGDAENTLNDVNAKCSEVPIRHNDALLIVRGMLVPRNHYKIRVWISSSLASKMDSLSISTEDETPLNDLTEKKYQDFKLVDEMIVKNEMKLEDLQVSIQSLLLDRSDCENCEYIRLRLLKRLNNQEPKSQPRFQMKKALFDWHKSLKQLNLTQENDICVQILPEEDTNLNQGIVLLDCVQINIKTRKCFKSSFKQILWNVNNGATLQTLKESILKAYELQTSDLFRMSIAKRQIEKCNWILLKESVQSSDSSNNNQTTQTTSKKGYLNIFKMKF